MEDFSLPRITGEHYIEPEPFIDFRSEIKQNARKRNVRLLLKLSLIFGAAICINLGLKGELPKYLQS